jgi:hypothetical protein
MNRITRLFIGMIFTLALVLGASALAGHPHRIQTPGTCVENAARGQTQIDTADHAGYHRFHDNVHKGQGAVDGVMERSGNVTIHVGPCP